MPSPTPKRTRAAHVLLTVGLVLTGWFQTRPAPAEADTVPVSATLPATVSTDALPTWQVTGVVYSQVAVGNTVYATGAFTRARPPGVAQGGAGEIAVGNLIAYDITTGQRIASFNHTLDAQGLAVAASPDGKRVYVGGDFTVVDGKSRPHLVAFDVATGALVTTFSPVLNDEVKALTATATTVYAGGEFTAVTQATKSFPRRFLASFSATDGTVTGWAPKADNGYVWSMTMTPDKASVVVGGQFSTVNGVTANGMTKLDASTGTVQTWRANSVIFDYHQGAIDALTTDGTSIYGGGFAFGVGGGFEGSFALDPADGTIRWLADCQGDTYDVEPAGDVVYVVGHEHNCTMVGGFSDTDPRTRWQSGTAFTAKPTGVNGGPDIYGWNFKGRPAPTLLHWFPKLALGTATGQYQAAWSAVSANGYVALGGEFPKVNDTNQQGLTRFAKAGAPNRSGPKYDDTAPVRTSAPATTATSTGPTSVQVTFGAAWDTDNQRLTYDLYRDRGTAAQKLVKTLTVDSSFWVLPGQTVVDTGVPTGPHTYQVLIRDPFGNQLLSPVSNQVSPGANIPPTADFTSTADRLHVTFSGSPSSDPDGTVASWAWEFGDGQTGSGTTTAHDYTQVGTYQVKLTVTDDRGAKTSATRSVSVTAAAPPLASDSFARSLASGWGGADTGGTWTHVGSASLFSVSGGQGRIRLNAGSGPASKLAASSTDTDLQLVFGFDQPSTGTGLFVRSVVRGDVTNGYLGKVWVSGSQRTTLYLSKVQSGTETDLASVVLPGTYAPGSRYHLRVQAVGSGTTALRTRLWADGTTEPTSWQLQASDTTAALQTAGGIAVKGYASASVTNAPVTLVVDDVLARPTGGG